MQSIDISDGTKLLNAFPTYASEYFDSFDTIEEGNDKSVSCIVNQNTVLTLGFYYPGYLESRFNIYGTGILYQGRANFATMRVFENGILLTPTTGESYPILICKRNNGDTAIILLLRYFSDNTPYVDSVGIAVKKLFIATINRDNGNVTKDFDSVEFSSNVTANVLGYTPFSKYDGITLKDVYIVTDSDFRSRTEPFRYSLNGQTYTGIAGNYFAVKGN